MFIGHLPGAYLVFKTTLNKIPRPAFIAGLVGGVAPDIDLFWFYFVHDRAVHHHEYITHRPLIWIAICLLGLSLRRFGAWGSILAAFGFGGIIHTCLDTIAGAINWLWPIGDLSGPLVIVQATHDHWIKSFLTHWTFQVEIGLTLLAVIVFILSQLKNKNPRG